MLIRRLAFLLILAILVLSPGNLPPAVSAEPLVGITGAKFEVAIDSAGTKLLQGYSIQLNFFLMTPSSSPDYLYVVQNSIHIGAWDPLLQGYITTSAFQLWKKESWHPWWPWPWKEYVPFGRITYPASFALSAEITAAGKLRLQNNFLQEEYESLGDQFLAGSIIYDVELIIVGFGGGPPEQFPGTGLAEFTPGTKGSCNAYVKDSSIADWQRSPTLHVETWSVVGSQEKARNLRWTVSGSGGAFEWVDGEQDIGIYIDENPYPEVARPPQFPSALSLGQTATIRVETANTGWLARWQTISVSFPDLVQDNDITAITKTQSDISVRTLAKGEMVSSDYGRDKIPLPYVMVEASVSPWLGSETHYLSISVSPRSEGIFRFRVKSVAARDFDGWVVSSDPDAGTLDPSVQLDDQMEWAYEYFIIVSRADTHVLHVGSSPPGVSISYSGSYTGTTTTPFDIGPYSSGFSVTLSAPSTYAGSYRFGYWLLDGANAGSSNSLSVTLDDSNKDRTAVAVYETTTQANYVLHVTSKPSTGVTISYSGGFSGSKATYFELSSSSSFSVTLTAPDKYGDYPFLYWLWGGNQAGSGTSLSVTVDDAHNGWYADAIYRRPGYTTTTVLATSVSTVPTTSWVWTTTYLPTTSTYTITAWAYSPTITSTAFSTTAATMISASMVLTTSTVSTTTTTATLTVTTTTTVTPAGTAQAVTESTGMFADAIGMLLCIPLIATVLLTRQAQGKGAVLRFWRAFRKDSR